MIRWIGTALIATSLVASAGRAYAQEAASGRRHGTRIASTAVCSSTSLVDRVDILMGVGLYPVSNLIQADALGDGSKQ